uniref:Uncharacterized protein n=1 Tax=Rhizophagus irregularis (strain DAOM 181602 / DAOM 197198 / MUCL 43194) TaxID=747089 RepID=U9ULN6_RHIID
MTEIKVYTYGKRMKYNLEQYLNVLWEDLGSKILKKILEEILRENFSEGTAQKEPIVSSSSHNKELSQD